jgi:phenylpropionate dioxygenase-like ring-hydroxylating dioxygenase large terminal subunit
MLTRAENELLTRVGPGTPMGGLLRRYWFPVCRSRNLTPGGPPRRVRLLGERFVLFRAEDGRLALFAEGCPHRGVSLALARNEGCAIRCIFHGWKIDVEGNVVDVPSEPLERERFGAKVKVRKYHAREAGGLIWAYAGAGDPPQFPDLPFTHLPLDHVSIIEIPVNANWLQGVEGQLDSSHVSILHQSTLSTSFIRQTPATIKTKEYFLADQAPSYEIEFTAYGMQAAAIRKIGGGELFARVTAFCLPSWTCIPNPTDDDFLMIGQMPVDDTHTIQWYVMHNPYHPVDRSGRAHGFQSMLDYDGESFARVAAEDNNWTQDRAKIDDGTHWSGLKNILYEDIAIMESQGPIADRTQEYLGRSDAAVTRMRRLLLDAVREHERGVAPPGLREEIDYRDVYGRQAVYREGEDWREAIKAVRV